MPREFKCETASGEVRGIRRRKGAGFSSEIETWMAGIAEQTIRRRKGAGFSSEIETKKSNLLPVLVIRRKGAGFSSEIETSSLTSSLANGAESQGGWLLV